MSFRPDLDPPAGLAIDETWAPPPDPAAEPAGFLVDTDAATRLHFLDWGEPDVPADRAGRPQPSGLPQRAGQGEAPGIVLIHGLGQTAWAWAPVARRLHRLRRVVSPDLRGHGLSDAPTHGYDAATFAQDLVAVAESSALLDRGPGIVVAGHGFGAIAAAWGAASLGDRCTGLVLVDGGWDDVRATTGMEPDEFLRTIEEPRHVYRSMSAWLADRAAFDPPTWDADQERAARAAVVEVPAGRVVPATRPHALAACVEAMFAYRPADVLPSVSAPIVAIVAQDDELGTKEAGLGRVVAARREAGRSAISVVRFAGYGHNLMRYKPAGLAVTLLALS